MATPRKSPSKKAATSAKARRSQQTIIMETEDSAGEMEPMDVVLGVVFLLGIPLIMFVLLGFLMSDSSSAWEEQLRLKELKLAREKTPPAMTPEEYDDQWKRISTLLDVFSPDYVKHYHGEKNNLIKQKYFECAYKVSSIAEKELEDLLAATKVSRRIQGNGQEVERKLNQARDMLRVQKKLNLIYR